jgi:hypothetical protein
MEPLMGLTIVVIVFVPLLILVGYAIGHQHGKEDGILWNRKFLMRRRAQIPESHSRDFWRRYVKKLPVASVKRDTAA